MMTRKIVSICLAVLALVVGIVYFIQQKNLPPTSPSPSSNDNLNGQKGKNTSSASANKSPPGKGMPGGFAPTPAVEVVAATTGKIDESLAAVGNIVAKQTVTIKARVDGYLQSVNFQEGQQVKAGQLLFQIDPRPFKIAHDQIIAQAQKNQALLANAKLDLQRLIDAGSAISKQQVDTQKSLIEQLQATIQGDKAQLENAKLQLDYARVSAPFSGRVGLRQIDQGNLVRSSDSLGLVNISQTRPIYGVFSLPGEQISQLRNNWLQGKNIEVNVYANGQQQILAKGKLIAIDNQMDSNGSIRLKAEFANQADNLLPNQLTNFKITVAEQNGVLIPISAVQRGKNGTYVYVAKPKTGDNLANKKLANKENNANVNANDKNSNYESGMKNSNSKGNEGKSANSANAIVELRKVELGVQNANQVIIRQGVQDGELVVTEGLDRLRDAASVNIISK